MWFLNKVQNTVEKEKLAKDSNYPEYILYQNVSKENINTVNILSCVNKYQNISEENKNTNGSIWL